MPESETESKRARRLAALASLVVVAVIAVVVFDVMRRANGMRTSAASAAALMQAQPGRVIEAVVRLGRADAAGRYPAEILERIDETRYRLTASRLTVELTPQTRFIMGSAADVKPRAIVDVAGTADDNHVLRGRRIVILTDYLKVTDGR